MSILSSCKILHSNIKSISLLRIKKLYKVGKTNLKKRDATRENWHDSKYIFQISF